MWNRGFFVVALILFETTWLVYTGLLMRFLFSIWVKADPSQIRSHGETLALALPWAGFTVLVVVVLSFLDLSRRSLPNKPAWAAGLLLFAPLVVPAYCLVVVRRHSVGTVA